MSNTPKARAAAKAALNAYAEALDGKTLDEYDEQQTALKDLLADLMHLADAEPLSDDDPAVGFDFPSALVSAEGYYDDEQADELDPAS